MSKDSPKKTAKEIVNTLDAGIDRRQKRQKKRIAKFKKGLGFG